MALNSGQVEGSQHGYEDENAGGEPKLTD